MVHNITNTSNNSSPSVGNSYAKPNRALVFDFGKGNLKIAGSTMDLLMYLSPYVDIDGRIVISLDMAGRALNMQTSTLTLAVHQALENNLLYKKNNYYYSRFHIQVGKSNTSLSYLQLLKVYTSPTVLNYSLNLKRLFYYFASFTKIGTKKKVSVENLYRNELHTDTFGVSYFETYKELKKAMLTLIQDDLIQVQLIVDEESNIGPILSYDSLELERTFDGFFGKSENETSRTSALKREKHKMKVQLSDRIIHEQVRVVASETEFRLFADVHGICWEDMNAMTKNILFKYKSELFNRFGEIGLSIYRKSIQAYLNDHSESVLYHDLVIQKTANYVMDFYLLEEIKKIIVAAMKQPNVLLENVATSHLLCDAYLINKKDVPGFIQYFLTKASSNHLIQLDDVLDKNNIDYNLFMDACPEVKTFDRDVYEIYGANYEEFKGVMDGFEWREYIRDLANKGLLAHKVAFENEIQELKKSVLFISKHGYARRNYSGDVEFLPGTKKVPFYNWLEEY